MAKSAPDKAAKKAYTAAHAATQAEYADAVAQAAVVDHEEALRIQRSPRVTASRRQSAERAVIAHTYGVPVTASLVSEDARGILRSKVHRLAALRLVEQGLDAQWVPDARRLAQGLTARVPGVALAARLLGRVLARYGVSGPVADWTGTVTPVADFATRIRPYLPLIRRLYGVEAVAKKAKVNGTVVTVGQIDEMRLLSRILAHYGLRLRVTRTHATRVYHLDVDHAQHMVALSQAAQDRYIETEAEWSSDPVVTMDGDTLTDEDVAAILGR